MLAEFGEYVALLFADAVPDHFFAHGRMRSPCFGSKERTSFSRSIPRYDFIVLITIMAANHEKWDARRRFLPSLEGIRGVG